MSDRPGWPKRLDSIRIPDSDDFRNACASLRRNNPAQRMTPGQHDAAMIDLGGRPGGLIERGRAGPLNQRPAARGTPVGNGFQSQHGVAMAANTFHLSKPNGCGRLQ
jgi:hypothetical protein